jgi:hypothetical protein
MFNHFISRAEGETKVDEPLITKEEVSRHGRLVSECLLSNYTCTVASVLVGMGLGIWKKNLKPFLIAITVGSVGDIFYGYTVNCRTYINEYEKAKRAFEPKTVPMRSILVPQEDSQKDSLKIPQKDPKKDPQKDSQE